MHAARVRILSALCIVMNLVGLAAAEGKFKPLRKNPPQMAPAPNLTLEQSYAPSRQINPYAPLRYELEEGEQFSERLLPRMEKLQLIVNDAMALKPNGERPSTDDIVQRLKDAYANLDPQTSPNSKNDLGNMLIAALVTAKWQEPKSSQPTAQNLNAHIWSYRRLFNGANGNVENWGPMIEVSPGSVLFIPVLNILNRKELREKSIDVAIPDSVPTGDGDDGLNNAPHDFDTINLHTHGLNVSPEWPSDDIFRQIKPYQLKFFVYKIPEDHPTGTFFYHPHHHGSVATQVAGGMAGALIVRHKDPAKRQGLDRIAQSQGWPQKTESILLIQQLSMYRKGDGQDAFTRPDLFALKDTGAWTDGHLDWVERCRGIRQPLADYARIIKGLEKLNMETWVSGQQKPALDASCGPMRPGELRRFRLIHAGVEENIDLSIRTAVAIDADPATGQEWEFQVIARDGIPLRSPYTVLSTAMSPRKLVISPGNRADVLVQAPRDLMGTEKVTFNVCTQTPDGSVVVMATFQVDPTLEPAEPDKSKWLDKATAESIFNNDNKETNTPSIRQPLGAGNCFKLAFGDAVVDSQGTFTPGTFQINHESFPGDEMGFLLNRHAHLTFSVRRKEPTDPDKHPLHIHVNPFLVPAAVTNADKIRRHEDGLPETAFWADTLLVYEDNPVSVQMPFHNWTGRFVSHCHILDHEDAGMMNRLRIDPPANGIPKLPISETISLPAIPAKLKANLIQEWPNKGQPVPPTPEKTVTIYSFMPKTPTGQCSHCAESVAAIANLRAALQKSGGQDSVKVRIIAITNGNGAGLPSAESLRLDQAAGDVLCSDVCHFTFEIAALIDSTPKLDSDGLVTYPWAFCDKNRCLKHDSDLMHGLFVVSPDGHVVSERRGFEAFDEVQQIMREVNLATKTTVSGVREALNASMDDLSEEEKPKFEAEVNRVIQRREIYEGMNNK